MKAIRSDYDTKYQSSFHNELNQKLISKSLTWNYSRLQQQPYYRMLTDLQIPMNNLRRKLIARCVYTYLKHENT